jgi:glycosyltransferase involved in cell wall biosynthesis
MMSAQDTLEVSVIIAAYNAERYIRDAIESVLCQTFADFELIVVDDGSTDDTAAILDSFTDNRIKVVHQENAGRYIANNRAMSLARGQYIANLDADDLFLPQKLERQVSYLDENPDIGLVGTLATIVHPKTGVEYLSHYLITDAEIRRHIVRVNPIIHSSVVFRKRVVDTVGPYSTEVAYGADYEYWIRIMRDFKVENIPEVLVVKREFSEGMTHTRKLPEHLHTALRTRIQAIRLLNIPPYYWFELIIPLIGTTLFYLGFNTKELGYRTLYPRPTDTSIRS